jgi:cyclohexanecarboxylate-CoA ligase
MIVQHPAPPEVQSAWRAAGAWTDETLLDRLARVDGAHLAIVDGDTRLTIHDLRASAAMLAGGLWELGVRPGTVVAWQLPNWWEGVVLCWAAWQCGAVVSPITPSLRAREVGFILRQSAASIVVVPHEFRGTDYTALVRDAGFAGTVVDVRGRARARLRQHRRSTCRSMIRR